MCLVLLSAGFETLLAEDSASGRDGSVDDTSWQAEHSDVTQTQMDTYQASENISDAVLKASGELNVHSPHEAEWVNEVPETREREETDSKGVPVAPDTTPSNNRTRSGNLDTYYGKSK
jgi:hypothetical protein